MSNHPTAGKVPASILTHWKHITDCLIINYCCSVLTCSRATCQTALQIKFSLPIQEVILVKFSYFITHSLNSWRKSYCFIIFIGTDNKQVWNGEKSAINCGVSMVWKQKPKLDHWYQVFIFNVVDNCCSHIGPKAFILVK